MGRHGVKVPEVGGQKTLQDLHHYFTEFRRANGLNPLPENNPLRELVLPQSDKKPFVLFRLRHIAGANLEQSHEFLTVPKSAGPLVVFAAFVTSRREPGEADFNIPDNQRGTLIRNNEAFSFSDFPVANAPQEIEAIVQTTTSDIYEILTD